jgi:hypothetical protein
VVSHLAFVEGAVDEDEAFHFWAAFDVEPVVAETLARLGVWWTDGKLQANSKAREEPQLVASICNAMLSVFRFRKFTDSRWLTVGDCCRSLAGGLALGLEGIVNEVRALPGTSEYYIHGFGLLASKVKQFVAIVAFASRVPDSALLALLEDDRLAARVGEVEAAMEEELQWIGSISDFAWGASRRSLGM